MCIRDRWWEDIFLVGFWYGIADPLNVFVEWTVYGDNPENGTITPQGIVGVYGAPCRVPPLNPVWIFYRIKDNRIPFSPVAQHDAFVRVIQGPNMIAGVDNNTCGPAPVWEGTVNQRFDRTGFGQTTTITNTASVVFEFDDKAHAQPGQVIYRLRSGSYTYHGLYVSDRPCQTVTTAAGPLPTVPYKPGVLGTTAASLVFQTGTTPARYYGGGDSIVLFTETGNCNSYPNNKTTIYPFDHFWWLQSGGDVSPDGKTIQGSQDQPDGVGGTLHWDWKLVRKG